VKDEEFIPSRMNGADYQAGKYAFSLRKQLMREHLGLLESANSPTSTPPQEIDVTDPVIDSFYQGVWNRCARDNARLYEEVFRTYPTNLVESFEELLAWRAEPTLAHEKPEEARSRLRTLVGRVVEFPINFLRRENLAPTISSKEGLVPSLIFT